MVMAIVSLLQDCERSHSRNTSKMMAERALIFLFSDASDVYLKIYPQEVELMMETKTKHYFKT
jgi:hypothetical protein